jgi:hypothetical protein
MVNDGNANYYRRVLEQALEQPAEKNIPHDSFDMNDVLHHFTVNE